MTESGIANIYLLSKDKKQAEIATLYGIHASHVSKIIRRQTWITGKKAPQGFRPGDPNNPSTRRRHGLIAAPIGRRCKLTDQEGRDHLAFAERLVPHGVVDREHIVSEIVFAIICGASPASIRWQDFRTRVHHENFEPAKRHSTPKRARRLRSIATRSVWRNQTCVKRPAAQPLTLKPARLV
jgi:hypothetical protein